MKHPKFGPALPGKAGSARERRERGVGKVNGYEDFARRNHRLWSAGAECNAVAGPGGPVLTARVLLNPVPDTLRVAPEEEIFPRRAK